MMAFSEFRLLDEKSLIEYRRASPSLSSNLGNKFDDYHPYSGASSVIKQVLPYICSIGESWPMTNERACFEALGLKEHGRLSPEHVPEVYPFDSTMSLIGMRYLEFPHIILRKVLIAGIEYSLLAEVQNTQRITWQRHWSLDLSFFVPLQSTIRVLIYPTTLFQYCATSYINFTVI